MTVRKLALGRRDLLRGALVLPFTSALVACSSEDSSAADTRFVHGIASGDPLPDGIVLWTHVTSDGGAPVDVDWEVAEDPSFAARVQGGTFKTDADRDFTVKVDVRGLAAGKTYYYRFKALGSTSKVGRTRTAPAGAVDHLRFAVMSCSSYAHGYFHAYAAVAEQLDIDAVLHLGDYIYEYGDSEYGQVRTYQPSHECLSLADYRTRHAYYKKDPDVQEVHRQHPFITIWDDHETANDAYKDGAENHQPDEGSFADRRAASTRAYREWMPIREQSNGEIFRTLAYGDLVDIVLLDTRLHARTKQPGGFLGSPPPPDPTRTLLGDDQADWMEGQLKASKAKWKLLAQQVMVGNLILEPGKSIANLDQWHGYPESRTRLLNFFRDSGVENIVVLTGDIHSTWVNELVIDPNDPAQYDPTTGKGSLGVEFVTPAITSEGIPTPFLGLVDSARKFNPHIRYVEPSLRGFILLDVTRERTQADWYHFQDITVPERQKPAFATAWGVASGQKRLNQASAPAATKDAPPRAP